jgi:ABC-type transport system involved in cytochrome c biogenesis permease subunit
MLTLLERVTIFCFAASYAVALLLELWHLLRPRPIWRYLSNAFGAAGLLAHVLYLVVQRPSLVAPLGSLLFLALILAIFYLYGAIHHHRLAWGLFVLPLVLGLIGLAVVSPIPERSSEVADFWDRFWGWTHGILLLLAAIGICVGFVASLMYLVQMQRLRAKLPPGKGMHMLSLERIEAMNRHAIVSAFPLLTAGVVVGLVLQLHHGLLYDWDSPKLLSTFIVWLVFALLVYLRYWVRARGRQVALLTMIAFVLLIVALITPGHPFVPGVAP